MTNGIKAEQVQIAQDTRTKATIDELLAAKEAELKAKFEKQLDNFKKKAEREERKIEHPEVAVLKCGSLFVARGSAYKSQFGTGDSLSFYLSEKVLLVLLDEAKKRKASGKPAGVSCWLNAAKGYDLKARALTAKEQAEREEAFNARYRNTASTEGVVATEDARA